MQTPDASADSAEWADLLRRAQMQWERSDAPRVLVHRTQKTLDFLKHFGVLVMAQLYYDYGKHPETFVSAVNLFLRWLSQTTCISEHSDETSEGMLAIPVACYTLSHKIHETDNPCFAEIENAFKPLLPAAFYLQHGTIKQCELMLICSFHGALLSVTAIDFLHRLFPPAFTNEKKSLVFEVVARAHCHSYLRTMDAVDIAVGALLVISEQHPPLLYTEEHSFIPLHMFTDNARAFRSIYASFQQDFDRRRQQRDVKLGLQGLITANQI